MFLQYSEVKAKGRLSVFRMFGVLSILCLQSRCYSDRYYHGLVRTWPHSETGEGVWIDGNLYESQLTEYVNDLNYASASSPSPRQTNTPSCARPLAQPGR